MLHAPALTSAQIQHYSLLFQIHHVKYFTGECFQISPKLKKHTNILSKSCLFRRVAIYQYPVAWQGSDAAMVFAVSATTNSWKHQQRLYCSQRWHLAFKLKTTGSIHLPLAQHQGICWHLTNKCNNNSSSNFIYRGLPGLSCLFLPSLCLRTWWEVSPEAASQTVSKRLSVLRVKLRQEHFAHVWVQAWHRRVQFSARAPKSCCNNQQCRELSFECSNVFSLRLLREDSFLILYLST